METKYVTVDIDSIIIDRPNRQRKELKGLDQLASSIREIGLINPPIVTPELLLIAGERRLTACKVNLGYTSITVGIRSEEPTAAQRQVELAENVERLELDWKDRCFAIKEYHELALEDDPEWRSLDTAMALNMGEAVVSRHISLARELEKGTDLICKCTQYSTALGIMDRMTERRKQVSKDDVRNMLSGTPKTAASDPTDLGDIMADILGQDPAPDQLTDDDIPDEPTVFAPFRCADFNRFAQNFQGEPFNFLHCDFPYGIKANKHNSGAASSFGGYEDSEDVYWQLIDSLGNAMDTLVAPYAHMMFWFSMDYYQATKDKLESFGWVVNPFPMVWYKSDNSGILPDPKRGPRRGYETAFLCSRGDRKIVQAVSNTFPHPNTKNIHMSEKPIPMLRHFFRMFVDDTTSVLDPTMGSGNAIVLAESLGAARALGLEQDKTFYETARDAYLSGKYNLE